MDTPPPAGGGVKMTGETVYLADFSAEFTACTAAL